MVTRRFRRAALAACLLLGAISARADGPMNAAANGLPADGEARATAPAPAPVPAAAAAAARTDTLAALDHRLQLAADGSAELLVTVVLGAPGPARLRLPFGYRQATDFALAEGTTRVASLPVGPDGAPAPVAEPGGRRLLTLELAPTAAAGDTVRVSCRLAKAIDWDGKRAAFGAYDLTRTFVNDTELTIGTYRLELVLPREYRVRVISGSEPAFKPQASPTPPYALTRRGGRDEATLTAPRLRPGDRARLGLVAERSGRGPVPLFAGLGLAALYLVFFRSQITRPRAKDARGPNQEAQA